MRNFASGTTGPKQESRKSMYRFRSLKLVELRLAALTAVAATLGCSGEDFDSDVAPTENVGESAEAAIPGASVGQTHTVYSLRAGSTLTNATVQCPGGSVMVGGGFLAPSASARVFSTGPDGNGWSASVQHLGSQNSTLTLVTECLSGTRATSSTAAPTLAVIPKKGGLACATAACPSGTLLTGGGYTAPDSFRASTSRLATNGGWMVCGWNEHPTESINVSVYPVCVSGVTGSVTRQYKGNTAVAPNTTQRFDSDACPVVEGATRLLLGSGGFNTDPVSVHIQGSTRSFQESTKWSITARNLTAQYHGVGVTTACLNLWQ
jgi:hypothetical protein